MEKENVVNNRLIKYYEINLNLKFFLFFYFYPKIVLNIPK